MENYRAAYQERLIDQKKLEDADRRIAAMHFGGVVIECLLKAMRVELDGLAQWHVPEQSCPGCGTLIRPGNTQPHGIVNPGHQIMKAIQKWPLLWQRLTKMNPTQRNLFLDWLQLLETPSCQFIDLRYKYQAPSDAEFATWQEAFRRFNGWICRQDQQLKRRRR